jgi:hypothetical protein
MARANEEYSSLRFGLRDSARVVVALLVSVLLHIVIWAGYYSAQKWGWWEKFTSASWLPHSLKQMGLDAQLSHDTGPTIFVDVSHADSDAPQKTDFYSNKSSRAANQETANSSVPKIGGTQTDFPKTEAADKLVKQAGATPNDGRKDKTTTEGPKEAPKETPKEASASPTPPQETKLEPNLPPPSLMPMMPSPTLPQPQAPGETDPRQPQARNSPNQTPGEDQPAPARPRTLKQALAQRQQRPGPQTQQDGGVPRHANWSSLDVKSTAFGEYDRQLIDAVQQRWDELLDNHRYAEDRNGKVTLKFKLKPDGTVIEMQTVENNVGEVLGYLCQEAIEEAAPFAKWPTDMSRMIGTNYRDITFTFYYY